MVIEKLVFYYFQLYQAHSSIKCLIISKRSKIFQIPPQSRRKSLWTSKDASWWTTNKKTAINKQINIKIMLIENHYFSWTLLVFLSQINSTYHSCKMLQHFLFFFSSDCLHSGKFNVTIFNVFTSRNIFSNPNWNTEKENEMERKRKTAKRKWRER